MGKRKRKRQPTLDQLEREVENLREAAFREDDDGERWELIEKLDAAERNMHARAWGIPTR